jgi:hypothetical protein
MSFAATWNRSRVCSGLVAGLIVAGASCEDPKSAPPAPASATASAAASASPPSSSLVDERDRKAQDEEIRPVYPINNDPPEPLAERMCDAVHVVPAKRRAECCAGSPGFTPYAECVRTLSYAIRSKAVALEPADVDKCAQAVAKELEGCGWVSPSPPTVTAACDGIIHGRLKERAVCRSSLECVDGLGCLGLSATQVGRCGPPKPAVALCNTGIDTLAAFTRQNRYEEAHPDCAGYCIQKRCQDAVALGGACKTHLECGAKRTCVSGKCSSAPLPGAGQPCPGGSCALGLRCVKGACVAPKGEGEACETDLECRGGCERPDGGATGACGKRCSTARLPGPLGGRPADSSRALGGALAPASAKPAVK